MAINQRALLKKLKKQLSVLQRKEKHGRNQLRAAFKKLKKMGRAYKSKLASKVRMMQGKIAEARFSTYAKVAADLERQVLRTIQSKGKFLASAIAKIEKKHLGKLKKNIAKKGKKGGLRKAKPKSKSKAMHHAKPVRSHTKSSRVRRRRR